MHARLSEAATGHTPYPGAITLDNLDDLFAHTRAAYGGFTMKTDDDGDGDGDDDGDDFEVDGDGDDDGDGDGDGDDDGDEGDDDKDKGAKTALQRERERNKALRRQLAEARAAGKKKDDDGDGNDAEEKAAAKWKPRVVNSAAKAALLAAGAEKPERLLKLIEHDDLDVDEDGDVQGLDDEVDRLKEEYPELFAKPRRSGSRLETGDRGKSTAKKTKSATERQAEFLTGKK